jgi:cytochrome c2
MNSTKEYGYFQRRSKRPQNWRDLQYTARNTFSETTILVFLMWFYEDLSDYLETPKSNLPG